MPKPCGEVKKMNALAQSYGHQTETPYVYRSSFLNLNAREQDVVILASCTCLVGLSVHCFVFYNYNALHFEIAMLCVCVLWL
jgi:hypothetical protein